MSNHYDIIIIGSGAGGGTLAHRLAPSGKRILLLERGGWLTREPENWDVTAVYVDNRYISKDSWTDKTGKSFQPQSHYFVGGATKMYGAALYRLRVKDFGALRHHDGISPAWPIAYDDLEPFYARAEELYQVHGARGEDPTEPPASGPYPRPAVSHEPRIQQLSDDLARAGYRPFHSPCGILLDESNMPFSPCVRCIDCDGYPCAVLAKSDADTIAVRPALAHKNLTLLTGAHARRILTNDAGSSVAGIVVERNGESETFTADIVVVSCGAANSAKLLLASATDRHPNGLANGSDQLGRNYVFHNSQAVLAVSQEPNRTQYQKTLGLNDFYFGAADADFPRNIQMIGKTKGEMYRGEMPLLTALAPDWALDQLAEHAVDFWLTTEDLPQSENRVTLERNGNIRLSYTPSNEVPKQMLYDQLKSMLGKLGMRENVLIPRHLYMKSDVGIAGVAHQAGTARFGTDAAQSVLDLNCKAHELDNLYVVDASFMPCIGAVNPGLTVMANALRVGDHLLERLGVSSAATAIPNHSLERA